MPHTHDPETIEKLKAALWHSTGTYVDSASVTLSRKIAASQHQTSGSTDGKHSRVNPENVTATPQFIGSLMELLWAQMESVAREVECFARHAGRTTVDTTDVMMLARRNESLKRILERHVESERGGEKGKK